MASLNKITAVKAWNDYVNLLFTGAILTEDQRGSSTEQLFKYAVDKINRDPTLLPNTNLVFDIQYVDKGDSWHASKKGIVFHWLNLIFIGRLTGTRLINVGRCFLKKKVWF